MKEFDFLSSVSDEDTKGPDVKIIGNGSPGGKASGLINAYDLVKKFNSEGKYLSMKLSIPDFSVIQTDIFDKFMDMNGLYDIALSDSSDERIAHEFQKAELPFEVLAELRECISCINGPVAIRSSSLLEDAKFEPFAGIYATKMLPNNQFDADSKCRKLYEGIKLIYASVFFKAPKDYMKATGHDIKDEKMAVIIQKVAGKKRGQRFYPDICGVAKSYNFYPMGRSKPEEGVADLGVGLGKTIVDGGMSWTYSPQDPQQSPPFASADDMLKNTQTRFWCINFDEPEEYDPINETEFMQELSITEADKDSALYMSASTLTSSGRVSPGTGSDGPRIINFAPLLKLELLPVNEIIKDTLEVCEKEFKTPVEIEFAVTVSGSGYDAEGDFSFLQVRPMVVSEENVEVDISELDNKDNIAASEYVLGNGESRTVSDIVYVDPELFDPANTRKIGLEIEKFNDKITSDDRKYLLIGFGRWGSSDPWLGIPVGWGQISGAHTIIEAGLENMNVELSQGSHFFHNMTSFNINYFSIPCYYEHEINWKWLRSLKIKERSENVVHVSLDKPLKIKVDGRNGRGIIKQSGKK